MDPPAQPAGRPAPTLRPDAVPEPLPDDGPALGPQLLDGEPLWQRAEVLFIAWRTGERHALDELVRMVTPVLWHIVRAYGLDRDSADDVVQTTWLTLVRRGDSVRDERAVLRWLTITARREAWRMSQRSRRAGVLDDDVLEATLPREQSAESTVVQSDEQQRLWAAVDTLSERCKRLLRVIAFSDRPDYAGLAEELQMPVGSIGPTRGRCLDKLRVQLTATHDQPLGGMS